MHAEMHLSMLKTLKPMTIFVPVLKTLYITAHTQSLKTLIFLIKFLFTILSIPISCFIVASLFLFAYKTIGESALASQASVDHLNCKYFQ